MPPKPMVSFPSTTREFPENEPMPVPPLRPRMKPPGSALPMPTRTVLGLPGGLIVPEDMKQLKQYCSESEDVSSPLVSAFEIRGRELVLYWRDLAPGQKIQVPLDLIARAPGRRGGLRERKKLAVPPCAGLGRPAAGGRAGRI